MTLDHDSGSLSGEVRDGPFAGRLLSQLSFDEALDLYRSCAADPQSAQLLEAWLDRIWPDWRETMAPHGGASSAPGPMSRQEACDILGVAMDDSREAIKEAHRRLMIRLHPDHGGSNYLAAKINQAKDLLLKD
jgi:DnaJ-domain-containing protein 1